MLPSEISNSVNSESGYIAHDSRYANISVDNLFVSHVNVRFACDVISRVLQREISTEQIAAAMHDERRGFATRDRALARFANHNPVQQLALANHEFITAYVRMAQLSPDAFDVNYYGAPHATGGYTAASWSDGTWHPEHLFTNTVANSKRAYYDNTEVFTPPRGQKANGSAQLGSRYASSVYGNEVGVFPVQQRTPHSRRVEHDITEALADRGDRRVQNVRGYNTANLRRGQPDRDATRRDFVLYSNYKRN